MVIVLYNTYHRNTTFSSINVSTIAVATEVPASHELLLAQPFFGNGGGGGGPFDCLRLLEKP